MESVHQIDGHRPSFVHQILPFTPFRAIFPSVSRWQHVDSIQASVLGSILKTGKFTGTHSLPFSSIRYPGHPRSDSRAISMKLD